MTHRNRRHTLVVIIVAATVLAVSWWLPGWRVPAVILGVAALVLFYTVRWHAANTSYACPNCHHRFMVDAWTDFINPHYPDKKLLRCPSCGKRDWCTETDRSPD